MKKSLFSAVVFFLTLSLFLTACSASSHASSVTNTDSLTEEGQLLVGTLKLESSTQAVSAEQAASLLPLWETLQAMASTGTGASQEVQALVDQIQSAMTTDQLTSITAMSLTSTDLATAIRENAANSTAGTSTVSSSSNLAAGQSGGVTGGPGNGNPPGGGSQPSDLGASVNISSAAGSAGMPISAATQVAAGSSTSVSSGIPASLITVLVEYLQKKAG